MNRSKAVFLVLASVACLGVSARPARIAPVTVQASTQPTPPTELLVSLDAGFLLVERESDGSVSAVLPKDPPDTPLNEQHNVLLTFPTGQTKTADGMPAEVEYALAGFALEIAGLPSGPVELPRYAPIATNGNCQPLPETDVEVNNSFYLPDLSQLHPGAAPDLTPSLLNTRIDLTGGKLAISAAQGCWQLSAGRTKLSPQSMVYGRESVQYTAMAAPGPLTVTLRPLAGGLAKTLTVSPVLSPDGRRAQVKLLLQYPDLGHHAISEGVRMADFTDTYQLLRPLIAEHEQYVPVATVQPPPATKIGPRPGRECATKRITVK